MKKLLLALLGLGSACAYAQNWTAIADMPAGVHHPVSWGIGDYGYAATGTNTSQNPTDNFYRYDPSVDNWSTLSAFPGAARSFAIGVDYKGEGYLGFGATSFNYLNDLWKYNPDTDTWTELASCPCAGRRHPSLVAVDDAIYIGLGDGAAGNLKDWWKYNINTDSWSQLPDLPGPVRHHPFQFSVNGEVYAGMGHGNNGIYDDWYRLDPATDTWTTMSNFPGEARVAGTQNDHSSKGYVLSGDGDNHGTMVTGEFWEYDYNADSWNQLNPHPGRSRWAPGSFIIKDTLYFFGGLQRLSGVLMVEAYKYPLASTISLAENTQDELNLYPNPARDFVRIDTELNYDEIQLINSVGQSVLTTDAQNEFSVQNLAQGLYHLQIKRGDAVIAQQKLLIQ